MAEVGCVSGCVRAISKTPNCYAWRQTTASVSHSTKRARWSLLSKSCWDLLQPSTSAIPSKYTKAQIRNFVVPDYGFAVLRRWGRSTSDDAEDRDAVREACWKDFECVGYGQKSDRTWDLLKYGDTKTNDRVHEGNLEKVRQSGPRLQARDHFESTPKVITTPWKRRWTRSVKQIGNASVSISPSRSRELEISLKKKLLYPGGKSPEDDWRFKYEHYYGVTDT